MPSINISEGQPFTYQLLNQIVTAVNNIKDPEDPEQEIEINGPGLSSTKLPKIIFGRENIDIDKNQTSAAVSVKFDGAFANENPIVVATLVDRQTGDGGSGTQLGYITITNITSKNFTCRIRLLKARSQDVSFQINYIAIGVGSDK